MEGQVLEEEEDEEDQFVGTDAIPTFYFDLTHEVADIDERSIPHLLLWKKRTALIVKLIQLSQDAIEGHTLIDLKQPDHFCNIDLVIGGMSGYFFKEDLMDVDQQFALQLELLPVLHVVVFELLLLVSLGWTADLWIAVFQV